MQLNHTHDISLNKIEAIVQTDKLARVKSTLASVGITTLRFTPTRSTTTRDSKLLYYREVGYIKNSTEHLKIEVVVREDLTNSVVKLIVQAARTEAVEDIEVLVLPIAQAVRISTNEISSTIQ
jgi:nitrogen regulatory protein PII